ncbi:MAG: hypothetical protein OIF48_01275 [Silicimonas sp.]|nr:hypothetical protein [Silicimonas sp.]
MIKALNLPGLALIALIALGLPQAATAEMAAPVLTDLGVTRVGRAEATRLYRADLTGLGLSAIGTITVNDSNSGTGGGVHSGFDLDILFLDVDGDLATTADRILATDHDFSVGSIRRGGVRCAPSGGRPWGR